MALQLSGFLILEIQIQRIDRSPSKLPSCYLFYSLAAAGVAWWQPDAPFVPAPARADSAATVWPWHAMLLSLSMIVAYLGYRIPMTNWFEHVFGLSSPPEGPLALKTGQK
jgi:hypothetical protein